MGFLKIFLTLSLVMGFSTPSFADGEGAGSANPFFSSCLYGTLAGTLIGVATLAFTSNPGDNLSNIARGASLGLYAGIALGLYLTYGVGESQDSSVSPPSQSSSLPKKEYIVTLAPVIDPSTLGAYLKVNF